jgi:hypothetical protein
MYRIKFQLLSAAFLFVFSFSWGQSPDSVNRWMIQNDHTIVWHVNGRLPHQDHIEISGEKISAILRYKVNSDGSFQLQRTLVWPMLRSFPNKTRANLTRTFEWDLIKTININDKLATGETVQEIRLNGLMTVRSILKPGLECVRTFFPSPDLPAYMENYWLKNISGKKILLEIPTYNNIYQTDSAKGVYGKYVIINTSLHGGSYALDTGKTVSFGAIFYAFKKGEDFSNIHPETEMEKRKELVKQWMNNLVLETPDSVLNAAFAFAKIRGSESIYRTKGGLMHSPGGEAYYAAIWANDQAEYIGPFFPFLGYEKGNEASRNAYLHFARFMNPEYKAIPSSIISEGVDVWQGAKDRGDAAMIAYGAGRFSLALGNRKTAEELWPLIEWCLEYCRRKITKNGVVASDSDELENRFPAGDANLCTSSLYYDALLSASYLAKALGKSADLAAQYRTRADAMKSAIEKHFGFTVEGYNTYRYYEGNDVLRAWICIPLTVGIFDRKSGTIDALFSPRLWTVDGLATRAGDKTFWDRSTLYALRGVFAAGEKEKALNYLHYYSNRRLLGEHIPYPVEAYPEGGQRHLSAESGLYCRIFTEGLFGIRASSLNSFFVTPYLPNNWNTMALRKIHAFQHSFDLEITKEKSKLRITVISDGKKLVNKLITEGETLEIKL